MRAVDTNIVVRLLARDDAGQADVARQMFRSGPILLTATVLLETEWVLRSAFKWPRAEIATSLAGLLDIETVYVPAAKALRWAIARFADGADFADVVHIAVASHDGASVFATFDRKLRGVADTPIPVALTA